MPEVFEPGALNYYTLSRFILWILSVFRNPTLTHLPLFGSLDSPLYDLIALTPGLAFFFLMTRTPAVASSFLSGRAYASPSFPPLSTTNDPDTPTVFHRCSGSRSSSDISFAPSSRTRYFSDISFAPSLAPGRCFSTWALTLTNSTNCPSFSALPPQRTSPFSVQKARWDDCRLL